MPQLLQACDGRLMDPLQPVIDDLSIEAIASALSKICRFGGHTKEFYSVAQHSLLVSQHCKGGAETKLWGLLHDAAEAYIQDVIRPLRCHPMFTGYRALDRVYNGLIARKWNLPPDIPAEVLHCDEVLLATEARDFLVNEGRGAVITAADPLFVSIHPLEPKDAQMEFLRQYYLLTIERSRT